MCTIYIVASECVRDVYTFSLLDLFSGDHVPARSGATKPAHPLPPALVPLRLRPEQLTTDNSPLSWFFVTFSRHLLHARLWTEHFKHLSSIPLPNTAVRWAVSSSPFDRWGN